MRQKPTLVGVRTKVSRAKLHIRSLEEQETILREDERYRFVGTNKHREDRDHIYRPREDFGTLIDTAWWSGIVGDCAHNLRAALDHLAWQLILASKERPDATSELPIRRGWSKWNPCTQRPEPEPLSIAGRVSIPIIEVIEEIQPYRGGDAGRKLSAIDELDVIDKHRHGIATASVVVQSTTSFDTNDADAPPPYKQRMFRPKNGEIAVRVSYERPYHRFDPHLAFFVGIAFGKAVRRFDGQSVVGILGELIYFVEDELVPMFLPFFSPPARAAWDAGMPPAHGPPVSRPSRG